MNEAHGQEIPLEYREGKEKEKKIRTTVILDIGRHGLKKGDALTPEGRANADQKGRKMGSQPEVSVVRSTNYDRTKETGAREMLANEDIGADTPLAEITALTEKKLREEQMLDKDYEYGVKSQKIVVDERLGFNMKGYVGEKSMKASETPGEYFKYMVSESDQDAIRHDDQESSTYSRYAGNVAEIVDRYAKIGNNFNKLASESETGEYEKYGNQLERYLVSHQGITENFLLKVLEKTGGAEKRDEFIKAIGEGFKELQGFRVKIVNEGSEQKILLTYEIPGENAKEESKKETIPVDKKIIDEIIEEKNKLNKDVADNIAEKNLNK